MNWIDVNKQLPPDTESYNYKEYLVTVTCDTWEEPKTMVMEWECTTVRNKVVKRWKWNDRLIINSWIVTHWMEFPKPYMSK